MPQHAPDGSDAIKSEKFQTIFHWFHVICEHNIMLCGVYNPLAENISSRDREYRHNNFFCNFFYAWLKLKIYVRHAKSHFR